MSDATEIADRLELCERRWPKSSRHFYRNERACIMDAERELRALAARVAELEKRVVETSVLAHGWMSAHDSLKAGKPYKLPEPSDFGATVKDATRYRWLRETAYFDGVQAHLATPHAQDRDRMDQVIDTFMAAHARLPDADPEKQE